ncbi:MAG: hypothetical protein AB1721_03025 [Patescibacteria group bacterium]
MFNLNRNFEKPDSLEGEQSDTKASSVEDRIEPVSESERKRIEEIANSAKKALKEKDFIEIKSKIKDFFDLIDRRLGEELVGKVMGYINNGISLEELEKSGESIYKLAHGLSNFIMELSHYYERDLYFFFRSKNREYWLVPNEEEIRNGLVEKREILEKISHFFGELLRFLDKETEGNPELRKFKDLYQSWNNYNTNIYVLINQMNRVGFIPVDESES